MAKPGPAARAAGRGYKGAFKAAKAAGLRGQAAKSAGLSGMPRAAGGKGGAAY